MAYRFLLARHSMNVDLQVISSYSIVVVEEYKDGENRLGILICIFLHQVLDMDSTLYIILHCCLLVYGGSYSLNI